MVILLTDSAYKHLSRKPVVHIASMATQVGVLTIIDGILTYLGMEVFHVNSEGNPLLRFMMYYLGVAPTLILTRVFAIGCLWGIVQYAKTASPNRILYIGFMLSLLGIFYVCVAILPWCVSIGVSLL